MIFLGPSAAESARLREVAGGRAPADLVIAGGRVVDVEAERILDGCSIAIAGGRIAAVGPALEDRAGPQTEVFDARGGLVTPGLIEPHTHLARLFIRETARLQLAAGVTTTILETAEVGYIAGAAAVRLMLAEARRAPGRILMTLSPMIGFDPDQEARLGPPEEWLPLIDDPLVVGVGEAYWAELLRGHKRSHALIAAAVARGLAVEGHGAGARPERLRELVALGVGSDHEPTTPDEVHRRLELGLHVYLRNGTTRQDLDALADLWADGPAPGRVALCTDGVGPGDLVAGRSLNQLVAMAAGTGLPVPSALRMATLVPATRFGLAPWLGTLAPGSVADLAVYPDETFTAPSMVLSSGTRSVAAPAGDLHSLDWIPPAIPLGPGLFHRPAAGRHRAMAILPESPLVTREVETDGEGALLAVAIDRIGGRRAFRGLVLGLGFQGGLAATTGSESVAMLVIGDSAEDMSFAAHRVLDMQGGVTVVSGGRERASWRAPVAGLLSDSGADGVALDVDAVNAALRSLGCRMPDPLTTIDFLTSPAIPHLRIAADGYHRLRDGAVLPLEIP
ncbi:MAG TPA: adenine deaminase C-terminal domain-containing protein [Candidatus Dormibacteraeota bacterium]|nr:adenine deaminase C-terminal domain-containing protein [Candidatus Dormibacteraeota bacterium]